MRKPDYERDGVRLYLADCLEVLPELSGVDAVVTDPPYGIGERLVRGGKGGSFDMLIESGANKWDVKPEKSTMSMLLQMSKEQIIWGGNFLDLPPCDKPLCWDKVRPNQKNLSEWEYAWTSLEGRAEMFRHCANGGFVASEQRVHPTQKPIPLMVWCLHFVPTCKTILDPFMGSGTTGVACIQTGRNFIGIEKDPTYFAIAVKRIDAALDADRDSLWTAKQLAEQQRELFTDQEP